MYESFFGFAKPPFRLVADPGMLFASESAREGLSCLEYALRSGKGFVVLSGEVGTGKTTLVNRFLVAAGSDVRTAYILNPTLTGLQLLKTLASELHLPSAPNNKVELTRLLYDDLLQEFQNGRRTVVFIDEAQALRQETLEELRLLTNLETWQQKLLQIVLVGQPELLEMLATHSLRQLRQRVELFIQMSPLSAEETAAYIEHRLSLAQPTRAIRFTAEAMKSVHHIARGIPREINKVCDASLLIAFVEETGTLQRRHVEEAVRTIDPQAVGLQPFPSPEHGSWSRLWAWAAAVAACAVLCVAADTGGGRVPETSFAGIGAMTHPRTSSSPPEAQQVVLVHLASFHDRSQAEAFARTVPVTPSQVVYLQSHVADGQGWIRVFLGDFKSRREAEDVAAASLESGIFRYAEPVQVTRQGLEAWQAP